MKSTLLSVTTALIVAALAVPSRADAPAAVATVAPSPAPTPDASAGTTQIEGGLTTDILGNNKGDWTSQYVTAMFSKPQSPSSYVTVSNNQRFGYTDVDFEGGVYIPTLTPNGTLELMAAASPQHNVLPAFNYLVGYDARAGGGMGYDLSTAGRIYNGTLSGSVNANIQTLGVNKYFGSDYVAVTTSFAKLSNVPGVATSYSAKVATYLPRDSFGATVSFGKDIENTGTAIAVYQSTGFDADELHWFSAKTALHAGLGFYNLAGAYGRFEVRLGLRQRI